MTNNLGQLIRAAIETVQAPRKAARQIMAVQMPRSARWQVLGLITVVSAILAYISLLVSAAVNGVDLTQEMNTSPFMLAISQAVVLFVSVLAIDRFGRAAGGTGTLDDAILLVAWAQIVLACLQVVQIAMLLVLPSFALLLGFAGMVLLFVLTTVFVAELHGFRSLGLVFASVLVVMLLMATILNFIFRLLGYDMLGIS